MLRNLQLELPNRVLEHEILRLHIREPNSGVGSVEKKITKVAKK